MPIDTRSAAGRWADTWQRAWQSADVDAIVALYHPDAVFSSEPFRSPLRGQSGARTYVEQAFADEAGVRASFGRPIVDGDRAAVQWWATLTENDRPVTLAGTSILRFDADGLVIDQWDAWNVTDGHRQPPPGWGE